MLPIYLNQILHSNSNCWCYPINLSIGTLNLILFECSEIETERYEPYQKFWNIINLTKFKFCSYRWLRDFSFNCGVGDFQIEFNWFKSFSWELILEISLRELTTENSILPNWFILNVFSIFHRDIAVWRLQNTRK